MATELDIQELGPTLNDLLDRVKRGEEITIAEAGRPIARIVPAEGSGRVFGAYKGRVLIADDFDDPLPPELQAEFEK